MNEEILNKITEAVENAVDAKINGKLIGIKKQLTDQDAVLAQVRGLLEDKKFLVQLWAFLKFLGGIIISIGTAVVIYKKLKL